MKIKLIKMKNILKTSKKVTIIKETFINVFGNSTLHGLPNVIRNEFKVMQLFWLMLFVSGVGACVYCKPDSLKHNDQLDLHV